MRELDKIDRRIPDLLQKDGCSTMTDLAAKVGLSTTPVTERVRRPEREDVITGYHARVNPEGSRQESAGVEIKLSRPSRARSSSGSRRDAVVPEVMECHLVSGDFRTT